MTKENVFNKVRNQIAEQGFEIVSEDMNRPWGGFFVINESQAAKFANTFFPGENFDALKITDKLSPKILIVAPLKRLSWQYHFRREEIWCCIDGQVAVAISDTDIEEEQLYMIKGDTIKLKKGQRHRLIGLGNWGVVAEIWQHTDLTNPSDEDDIVRLQDDFGR